MLRGAGEFVSLPAVTERLYSGNSSCGTETQRAQQMWFECIRSTRHRIRPSQLGQLRHLQTLVAAGIDPAEGFQVEIHVHGETVIAGMASDTDADAAELLVGDVDPGGAPPCLGSNTVVARQLDHALLKSGNDI